LLAPLGHRPRISRALCFLGILASRQDDSARAVSLVGSAEAANGYYRHMLAPNERADLDACLAEARRALGQDAFARAWAEAVEHALAE
jgi:hypothetical protein